jgi:hypothetical protein
MFKKILITLTVISAIVAFNPEAKAQQPTMKLYQTDKFGNVEYNKPHLVLKHGKTYQADKFGNIQYHKPAMTIKGGLLK